MLLEKHSNNGTVHFTLNAERLTLYLSPCTLYPVLFTSYKKLIQRLLQRSIILHLEPRKFLFSEVFLQVFQGIFRKTVQA
jgi:hypothetical protein